ncbi:tetratricopeptide repeat protein [bacterium]|nr:tetratricopeptide repeat protein [bacterium]
MLKLKEQEGMIPPDSTNSCLGTNTLELARKAHERYLLRLSHKDLNEALDYYIQTIKTNPELPETYYRLASLLFEDGQIGIETAIEQCKTALAIDPQNYNAHLYTGYFLKLAKNFDEAEKEFTKAMKITPFNSARARVVLGVMLLQKMNNQKVSFVDFVRSMYYMCSGSIMLLLDYPTLRMLYKNFKDDFSIFAYNLTGNIFQKINKDSLAVKTYDIAAEKTGHNELFYEKIGDVSIRNSAPEIALDAYKKVLHSNPYNREALIKTATLIQTYFEERADEAIDCYTKLLDIEPENSRIYYELGHLYVSKKDIINSVNAFTLALERDSENAFYHNSLAFALLQAEQYDDAIDHYKYAINLNPDNEWTAIVCQALGALYHQVKENPDAAMTMYQTALVLDPNSFDAYISIGDLYLDMNDLDSSINAYCEAIKLAPDNARAYCKMGIALWEKDYLEEAIIAYNKSITYNPEYDIAYNNLGVIYLDGIGNTKEALRLFKIAIDINENYALAYFNAGRAEQIMDNKTTAAHYYQKALELNRISWDLTEEEILEKLHSLFEV